MNLLQAIVLGIVEGVTEFLPISSTAHLILASHVLKLPQSEFVKTFEIAIQLGAILAVIALYWKKLLANTSLIVLIIAAFIPTAIIGFLLHDIVKNILFESVQTILIALFAGGIVLILFDSLHTEKTKGHDLQSMTYLQAALIGLFQSVAIIPGVSRAAATIIGGEILGFNRKAIVEFSFLLAIPTIAAATGLDLIKSAGGFALRDALVLALGFATSFIVAYLVIRWFLRFIETHSFVSFGIYRILIAVVGWLLLL